jgi:hypothetical protein
MPVRGLKELADEIADEARAGLDLVRAGRFHAPAEQAKARRVFYTPTIFVALLRALWADPALRTRYLRVFLPQAVLTVVVGVAFVAVFGDTDFTFHYDGKHLERTMVKNAKNTVALVGSVVGAMAVVEWLLIAFTRELHDAFTYALSVVVGVPPEEELPAPRVRLDVDWLITKLKRRVQGGFILLACILPPTALYLAVFAPLLVRLVKKSVVSSWMGPAFNAAPHGLLLVASAYWVGVFVLGTSAHAWRDEEAPDPFFLRSLDRVAERFPRAGGPFHLYARVLRRAVGLVKRPALIAERAPWETLGFVLLRGVIAFPGVYVLLRPLIPVASTVVIAARSPETLRGLPLSIVLKERA